MASLFDLTYLLAVAPAPAQWNTRIRASFMSGAMKVMEILCLMQGMDKMKRQVGLYSDLNNFTTL